MIASIRVRIGAGGEPELSVEDLRGSGCDDLLRLAAADQSSASKHGDDDDWLTPHEVEGAWAHYSIRGGYLLFLDEAKRRPVERVAVSDLQQYMTRARTEPVRHPITPPTRPVTKSAILFAKNYEPSFAKPKLLHELEIAIDDAITREAGYTPVSRGFALDRYGGPELVRYLYGDWRGLIGSHGLTRAVEGRLKEGWELHAALADAAKALALEVTAEIERDGFDAFVVRNSRATQIGIRDKHASGMAAWPDDRIDQPADMPNTPFSYARTGYLGLIHQRIVPEDQPMIVLEVDQRLPPGFGRGELSIPSHVPPTSIRRFFLGFSNWHNAHAFLHPPKRGETWYRFDIFGRDGEGRPTGMRITPIRSVASGYMERWEDAGESWTSERPSRAFIEEHPLLAPTIRELEASREPRAALSRPADRAPRPAGCAPRGPRRSH